MAAVIVSTAKTVRTNSASLGTDHIRRKMRRAAVVPPSFYAAGGRA